MGGDREAKFWASPLALVVGSLFLSSPAQAQDTISIVFGETEKENPSDPRWVVCYRWDRANDYKYVSDIRRTTVAEVNGDLTWADFILNNYEVSDNLWGGCNVEESASDAQKRRDLFTKHDPRFPKTLVPVTWTGPLVTAGKQEAAETKSKSEEQPQSTEVAEKEPAADAEKARAEAREKREAEFQAKLAEHEAEVAEYRRKVAEREAEIARQEKEQAKARDAAAREKAAYEAKMAAHRRELDAANQRQQEYFAAQRRHALCLNGDKAACDAIAAGTSAMGEQLAQKEEVSTDTDATTCVSRPVVSASATFKGQTQAVVFNGCETAVDVRICLLRTGGWNCGVTWGLKPQERWTHTSFETQGELFWDARVAGSSTPLASPGGN